MPPIQDVQRPNRRLNRRLDSWKEIAAFFDRDERTVKRWEKERQLPVHRLPGGSRARVFAFTEELSRWMHSSNSDVECVQTAAGDDLVVPNASEDQPVLDAPNTDIAPASKAETLPTSGHVAWWKLASACVLLIALTVAGSSAFYRLQIKDGTGKVKGRSGIQPRTKPNPEAEDLYLKGRYYWNKRTPADLNKAVDFFTQSIVRDPSYAPAYVGLADCYNLLREYTAMPPEQAFPRALAAAQKAVELDDSSAEAHASLAFVMAYWKWDFAGADREFQRAIELNPSYATAHHWYANFLVLVGRSTEAIKEIDRAQQLDPSSNPILADKALILFHAGHVEESTTLLKQIEASQPEFFSTHKYLSYIFLTKGDYRDYLAEGEKAAQLSHDAHELAIVRAEEQGFKAGGEREMFQHALRLQKKLCDEGKFSPFVVATTYARLGDKQGALHYLQLAYDRHDPIFVSLWSQDSFTPIHDDPLYRKLVAQSGIPQVP